jgi:hypothetical protein
VYCNPLRCWSWKVCGKVGLIWPGY